MSSIRTILVPVDFSPSSDAALDNAASMADTFGAAMFVLHVYEAPEVIPPAVPSFPVDEISRSIEKSARAGVDAIVRRLAQGRRVEGLVRKGSPWRVIQQVAGEVGADLVVVGTHGRREIERAPVGSVAEMVVRTSRVPVLTVRALAGGLVPRRALPTEPDVDGSSGR